MKQLNLCLLTLVLISKTYAQTEFNCSSHAKYEKQLATDLLFKQNTEQLELETKNHVPSSLNAKQSSSASYIIPVVFHVIHTGGSGNISDAQINDQINILNKEFNRLQADTALTPLAFKPLAAPFSVEFRLATKDPNGNCTNGINRIYSTLSDCSFEEDDVKALSYWPSNQYLNIWIVQVMHYSSSYDCVGGGYATFPGGPANLDGINIRGDLISNIGTAATNGSWGNFKGRYLIHELGHWFNLRHIWGDATCGNDLVNDTPPAVGSNSGCPSFPHRPNGCPGGNLNGEMFTNYMDYTNGPCLNMFSAGQVLRMDAAINSNVSGRSNLWSQNNLNATGTADPYTYPVSCVATPEAAPYMPVVICAGDSINVTDASYGGSVNSRLWNFSGGNPSSTTASIVNVKFNTPGVYSYTLTNTYQNTTKSKTFPNKIYVLDNVANTNYIVPFEDDFENPQTFGTDWLIINKDNDAKTWEHTNNTGYSGISSIGIANFASPAPLADELISPAYDLSNVLTPTLSFRRHFSNRSANNTDRLQIFVTKNCGNTWTQIYSSSAPGPLKTTSITHANTFTPGIASDDWRLEKINLMPSLVNGVVRFKFVFTAGGGNNIFIDDLNIDGINTTNINELSNNKRLKIYPNPANDIIQIDLGSTSQSSFKCLVTDLAGRNCLVEKLKESETSNLKRALDVSKLRPGVYFICIEENGKVISTNKFIKQSSE